MYRPESVRKFKTFVGELTATVAAVHVSLYESKDFERKIGESFWSEVSSKHGVILSGVETNKILLSQSRLSIVSLYSGFDAFSSELKEEKEKMGGVWTKKKDKEPLLDTVLNNALSKVSPNLANNHIICFDYYRLLRNSVVHPTKKNKSNVEEYYKNRKRDLDAIRELYSMQTAPNSLKDISFHDVKLLCRLLLDMTSIIGESYDPGNEALARTVSTKKLKRYGNDTNRVNNAIIGYVKTEYGLTDDRAAEVSKLVQTH